MALRRCSTRPPPPACAGSSTRRPSACTGTSSTRRPTRAPRSLRATSTRRRRPRPRRSPCASDRERGLPVAVVRPGAIYGPGETRLLKLFRAIARGRYAIVGSGRTFYHPVYIDDLVQGFLLALERPAGGRRAVPDLRAVVRLAERAGGPDREAHRRARAALAHPGGAAAVGRRPGRGRLRAARHRAAAAPASRRLLDEEPRVHDREGAPAARLRAAGRSRRRASRAPSRPTGRPAGCEARAWRSACFALRCSSAGGGVRCDLPRASRGEFWGDGATYYAMSWSLARDLDLRYERADLDRVRAEYPGGPAGPVPQARERRLDARSRRPASPGCGACDPRRRRLYYAKAFAYPVLAAPFVAAPRHARAGRDRERPAARARAVALACGDPAAARPRRRGRALAAAASLLLLTVAPRLPRLAHARDPRPGAGDRRARRRGRAAGRCSRRSCSASPAISSRPNLLMAAPLGLEPLLPPAGRAASRAPAGRVACCESLRRGLVLVGGGRRFTASTPRSPASSNYQGGERKTFYDRFPLDANGTTFDDCGLVDDHEPARAARRRGGTTRAVTRAERPGPQALRVPRGVPAGTSATSGWAASAARSATSSRRCWRSLLFLLRGPRDRAGWLALAAIVISWIAYLRIIPDNWYGGGGTVGQPLLPERAAGLPVPRAAPRAGAGSSRAALAAAAVFLAPVLAAPLHHSLRPGEHATRGAVARAAGRADDAQRPVGVHRERGGRSGRSASSATRSGRPTPTRSSSTSWTTGRTGGRSGPGAPGFWLRGEPPCGGGAARVRPRAGRAGRAAADRRADGRRRRCAARLARRARAARAGADARASSCGPGAGVPYYDTYLHVLEPALRSAAAPLADGRAAGAFVEPRLVMRPASRRPCAVRVRPARVALGVVCGLVLLVGARWSTCRVRATAGSGATRRPTTPLAGSLAFDGDVAFAAADLARVRAVVSERAAGRLPEACPGPRRGAAGSSTRSRCSTRSRARRSRACSASTAACCC